MRIAVAIAPAFLAGAVLGAGTIGVGAQQRAARIEQIHKETMFADLHAHPSHFHRSNVPRIEAEELSRYRRGLIDVVVSNVSSDAIYSGNFVERDGTEVRQRQYRPRPGEPLAFTLDRLSRLQKTIEDGDAVLASSPASVLESRARGQVALLLALEGADGLESKIENLRLLHEKGLRLLQLVHFRPNELGHIQTYPYSPGGLTPFGKAVVGECNRLGIVVDLAHANTETIMDALAISRHPVIFSHTAAMALREADRHVTDAEIRAIAAKGGVIGVWPSGSVAPRMDDMIRHIDHIVKLVGVDHVGIGSDLRGMGSYTQEFGEEANFLAIAEALLDRGYPDADVGKIMGGNFFRIWSRVTSKR